MFDPISTYRIQFHKEFTFSDLEKITPYLCKLGIKTIYASPIFKAAPGSMHGYDVTDPLEINPEIGTLGQLRYLSKKLNKLGISWLQDIVPNHMAFHPDNTRLMDVLEKGPGSKYASFFDILWDRPVSERKLMVPFLAKSLDEVIEAGELKLIRRAHLFFDYFGQRYPVNPASFDRIASSAGRSIEKINANKALLKQLANDQHYRLCPWQETDRQINYRRFFTVNGLICLNIQDEKVFNEYHRLIKKLVDSGVFQGLRVDHIDGLYDPKAYLRRLRQLVGDSGYIVVEKILEQDEKFPVDWPVQGNTGYDFLSLANNLFTRHGSKKELANLYKTFTEVQMPVSEQILQKKRLILERSMQGELENLYQLFKNLRLADDNQTATFSPEIFKAAIAALLVYCPVYRFYGDRMPLPDPEAEALQSLIDNISRNNPLFAHVNVLLEYCLLSKPRSGEEGYNVRALHFYQRLMQFTGPLMAKGVEDTLMYTYNLFIDHNEVGDSPAAFGIKIKQFHKTMQERALYWPMSMNASSTHDTKRGEDVRARLNVISDFNEVWVAQVKHWREINAHLKTNGIPDANDEYFIYQSIAGAYPMPGQSDDDFKERLSEYVVKALREGKRNSSWAAPDEEYEAGARGFAAALLAPEGKFWESFQNFHARLSDFGIVNSLAQVVLKYTCPGVADLYQGCELWNLSFVDPDNRRPVNYEKRERLLLGNANWQSLWKHRFDGQIKLMLINKLLKLRSNNLFLQSAEYIPIEVKGKYKENILAFARHSQDKWVLTVIPLHPARIVDPADDLTEFDWQNTRIVFPDSAPLSWTNLLNDKTGYAAKSLAVNEIFDELPVAVLQLTRSKNARNAGILLHITSLPSGFAIGDIGPQAYRFADFLQSGRQRIWQMLPVNPIEENAGYSPYSATSAMAGNVLLISPELLVDDGLLEDDDINQAGINVENTDFKDAFRVRKTLLSKAYGKFLASGNQPPFEDFKNKESHWLDDFAAFQYFKEKFGGKPWHQWPDQYKKKNKPALSAISKEIIVDQTKWQQFIFQRQWSALRRYCNSRNIQLLGDMPFYISYDSVDVWANPDLFKLDKDGNIEGVAGVPPDYFSVTGQLWGMPVYNWDAMKKNQYDWWLKRINRNLQFFDRIRIDHFRAFSKYWEVKGGSENAVNGNWQTGPGADFFEKMHRHLGCLPFVAEDLGDIDEAVYELRDQFNLPGMRVLQFAFDEAMPVSQHIPHNYSGNSIVYTGTHDNNTAKGWYENDIVAGTRKRINDYTGCKVNSANIHSVLTRLCYSSVAQSAIVPMQDIIGSGTDTRMNVPSSARGNWTWRLDKNWHSKKLVKYLKHLTIEYDR